MEATLNQPCRVQEDGLMGCKLLLFGTSMNTRIQVTVPEE